MAGRPVTFTKALQESAWKYIDEYQDHGHAVPSVVGLCAVIKRARSTIYDWAQRNDNEFSDILEAINEKQELVTVNGALKGELNPMISKLLLGKHGYHDRQDVDVKHTPDHGSVSEITRHIREMIGDDPDTTPITH